MTLSKPQQSTLQKHLEIIDNAKLDMVTGVVTIGASLIVIREIIDTGFVEWVEGNCGFGKSTAYRYIDAAEQFGAFPKLGNFQDSALYVLSRCEEAAKKAKLLANRGQRITHKMAEDLVREFKERGNSNRQIIEAAQDVEDVPSVNRMDVVRDEPDGCELDAAAHDPAPAARRELPAEPNVIGEKRQRIRSLVHEETEDEPGYIRLSIRDLLLDLAEELK